MQRPTNRRIVVSRFGGPEVLLLREEPVPQPDPGQVLIRILAAGVSYADLLMREGVHPEIRKPPFCLGWDLVGRVIEVGEGVSSVAEGQLVAGLPIRGAYSDYLCMRERDLVPVPGGLDPAEAVSLVLNYVTAYQMLHRLAAASAGHTALIHGAAGGVGQALLQLGSLVGMRMFGTASPAKKDIVSEFGATWVDYRTTDFVESVRRQAPDGVDIVFDGIGGHHVWRSRAVLRAGGKVVAYGLTSSLTGGSAKGRRSPLKGVPIIAAFIVLAFTLPGSKRIRPYSIQALMRRKPQWFRRDLGTLFQLLAERKIAPMIAMKFPLTDAATAHRLLATGDVVGKIVLDCTAEAA